jgi:hypothetical protein
VENFTDRFGVKDFNRYTDAVANQVYLNQQIRASGVAKSDQLILRSMLTNGAGSGLVDPAIEAGALAATDFKTMNDEDISDKQFYTNALKYAPCETSAFCKSMTLSDVGSGVTQRAHQNAVMEVDSGLGFKASRNCSGNLSEQENLERRHAAALEKFRDRSFLFDQLNASKKSGLAVPPQDLERAKKDRDDAAKELADIPESVDSVAKDVCEFVVLPGKKAEGIVNNLIGTRIENFDKYNDNNLPFLLTYMSKVVLDLTDTLLFGKYKSNNHVIDEKQIIGTAIGLGVGALANAAGGATATNKNIIFTHYKDMDETDATGKVTKITLNWDVKQLEGASSVSIAGPGVQVVNKQKSLIGDADVKEPLILNRKVRFTLTVYNESGASLGTADLEVGKDSNVKGAFTVGPRVQPRGSKGIEPR